MIHANEFIHNMELGDPTICVYKFIFNEYYSNNPKIIQYLVMHRLVLCIKLKSCVEHMFYAWSFSKIYSSTNFDWVEQILSVFKYIHHCVCFERWEFK